MTLTMTDLFAGAGGSSTGATQVPGIEVRIAANHWQLACDVHNANHPETDHASVDLHEENPRYFPRTDILWASPECTKWSQAGGSKSRPAIEEGLFEDPLSDEAATRSRLLMFDVLRFIEHHRYRLVMVENVVDIAVQAKYATAWHEWRRRLDALGYAFRPISLNAMHAQGFGAPAPQSRDRIYIAAWPKGEAAPDFEQILRPTAYCSRCDVLAESRQAWKPGRTVGRYRQAYVYVHGDCGTVVEPGYLPALTAIDFSIPGTPIGDRLVAKTRARIAAGIARYWLPLIVEAGGHTYDAASPRHPRYGHPDAYYRAWPPDDPLGILHTTMSKALAVPVEGRDGKQAQSLFEAMRTQTTRLETGLAMPFIAELRGGGSDARSTAEPAATFTAGGNHHALITRHYGTPGGHPSRHTTEAIDALRTLTGAGHQALIQGPPRGSRPSVTEDAVRAAEEILPHCSFRMLTPREAAGGMAFPRDYKWDVRDSKGRLPSNRAITRMAGNAVCPPCARDLLHVGVASLGAAA